MKRFFLIIVLALLSLNMVAGERETIWPEGKMPHRQDHQIAAMTDETESPDFNADKHRTAYIEWYDAPATEKKNGGCMILISGGSYECCCDGWLINLWNERFTEL